MPSNKLVDGDFLTKLLQNSMEVRLGQVESVIQGNAELFGGDQGVDVQIIGTFSEHVIVMNSGGQFFRATIGSGESLTLEEVEEIDVPVFEAKDLRGHVREHSERAVDALLKGDTKSAFEDVMSLYDLVKSGVSLTAESVEQAFDEFSGADSEWREALRENEVQIRSFLGVDGRGDAPSRLFTSIIEASSIKDVERTRRVVVHGIREMREFLNGLDAKMTLAREIDETYSLSNDDGMGIADFLEFVEDVDIDLQMIRGVVEDAITVSDEGTIKSLARIHDGVVGRTEDLATATSFAEKFARRFSAPQAA